MKKIFAIAAVALMCLPAFVSCKKNEENSEKKNFFSIDGVNKTVDIAYSVEHDDYYDLNIQLVDNFTFRFIIDKANVGKKINLREPDPLTKGWPFKVYQVLVFDTSDSEVSSDIADGWPPRDDLGEGSYMQIDDNDGEITLEFDIRGASFTKPFVADNSNISGYQKGFLIQDII